MFKHWSALFFSHSSDLRPSMQLALGALYHAAIGLELVYKKNRHATHPKVGGCTLSGETETRSIGN